MLVIFSNELKGSEIFITLKGFKELRLYMCSFLCDLLKDRKEDEEFKKFLSPEEMDKTLKDCFKTEKLGKLENFFNVRLNFGADPFFETQRCYFFATRINFCFSLELLEKNNPLGSVIIHCTKEEFEKFQEETRKEKLESYD